MKVKKKYENMTKWQHENIEIRKCENHPADQKRWEDAKVGISCFPAHTSSLAAHIWKSKNRTSLFDEEVPQ